MNELTIENLINNMPWLSEKQINRLKQYKLILSDESFTDDEKKTIYYTNPEFAYHEAYHAIGDNSDYEKQYKDFYHNLNDDRIKELGGDLILSNVLKMILDIFIIRQKY